MSWFLFIFLVYQTTPPAFQNIGRYGFNYLRSGQ